MTPGHIPEETGARDASGPKGKSSVAWQLLQVALLLALLGVGMYEVDLDAKAVAESRARSSLLSAIEGAARALPPPVASPEVARLVEAYAKACGDCACCSPVASCPGTKGPARWASWSGGTQTRALQRAATSRCVGRRVQA
jgi:hypothetical protein